MVEEDKEKKRSSAVDKVNNIAAKRRDLQRAYGAYKKARVLVMAAEGINPATIVIGAIALVLVVTILILFGGVSGVRGGNLAPECAGITAPSLTVTAGNTITLTVSGCTADVTYAWEPPSIGTLSNTDSASVTYTAPTTVTASTKTTLTVNVCSSQGAAACTAYSVDITIGTVSLYTCDDTLTQYCSTEACADESKGKGTCQPGRNCCKPAPSGKCGVVCWAKKLSGTLSSPNWCSNTIYNRRLSRITNNGYAAKTANGACGGEGGAYLCTYLVWDAYKLAGKRGPTSGSTCDQIKQWRNLGNGYSIQRNNLRGAKPGDALFWTAPTGKKYCGVYGWTHHTDMIYTINVNSAGTGSMQTLDANTNGKITPYTIRGWRIVGSPWIGFTGFWHGIAP